MSAEENKAIIRRYCEDFMTEGDLDVADELIHPNCRNPRGSSYWANGPESVKKSVASDREAVPDLRREVKDLVVEGNKVVLYSTVSGTHKGIGGPIPYAPTGEEFTMTGVSTFVIEDGRIVEEPWANWDFGQIFRPIAKAVVRRWIEEVYTGGNLDIVEELIDPNYILHDPFMPGIEGIDGVRQLITQTHTIFPDLHNVIEDLIAEENKVIARWTARGTHKGEAIGITPTGKQVTMIGTSIYRMENGKIAEEWKNWDALGFMQQLGAVPPIGEAKS